MITDISCFPVNWIDGMKISRQTFEVQDKFIYDQLRDITAMQLTEYNFGILPAKNSLDLNVSCNASNYQIEIELNSCKAITPNGCRIQILKEDAGSNVQKYIVNFKEIASLYNLQLSQIQNLYIIVTVKVLERIPFGQPDAEEEPPRHPYTKPAIKVNLLPADRINTKQLSNELIIGKIMWQNGELAYQTNFIPPCTCVNTVEGLIQWYIKFRETLNTWEDCYIKIIRKINFAKSQSSQKANLLALNIQTLCEKMLDEFSRSRLNYQWIIKVKEPVEMFCFLIKNIQYLQTVLQCLPEKDKEDMLGYFTEWMDIQPGMIDAQLDAVLKLQYNHYDINDVLQQIKIAYDLFVNIFKKQTELEYIGKRRGQTLFVHEEEVKSSKNQVSNERWNPLV